MRVLRLPSPDMLRAVAGSPLKRFTQALTSFETSRRLPIPPGTSLSCLTGYANTGLPEGWSIVYSAAKRKWGAPQTMTLPSQSFYLPSLASSPNGSQVELVYLGDVGARLYYKIFAPGNSNLEYI